jgi:tRNA pseudouridine38-40 synthase
VRTITAVKVRRAGAGITIDFSGDGFHYKMVRLLVGALVRCGQGKMPPARVRELLNSPAGAIAAERSVAPAEGLILMRVRY